MGALGKAKIVCFGATASAAKAKAFYSDTLGLPLVEESAFALVFNANGTTLRIQKVERVSVAGYTALGWEIDDIDAAVAALARKGIRFERYEGLGQDAAGIWTSPSGARVAWFKDPDGSTLSLTELSAE
jgi:catechol 2,3-dioxygenase-like lactoylglutathione lyase family enzyme